MSDKKNRGTRERPPPIDTAALLAKVDIVEVIGKRIDLRKDGAEFAACCPFHTEKTPSFKVSPAKQIYKCFGCGETGDAIKFLREYEGLSFLDACRELGADVPRSNVEPPDAGGNTRQAARSASSPESKPSPAAGLAESAGGGDGEARRDPNKSPWVPILPVPEDAPEPPLAHPFRGKYQTRWAYRDAEGRLLGFTCRFEKSNGGKEILPLTFCRHAESGATQWEWISFAEPRPLYGLDRLAARPDAPVLVVEGEKCVDAAQAELPDYVVVSWPGGGKAVGKADWLPLAERNCLGWPDCDAKRERLTKEERDACADADARKAAELAKPLLPPEKQPGVQAMTAIAERVLELGGTWSDVAIPAPGDKPDGWDVADAIAEGLTGSLLLNFIRAGLVPRERSAEGISTPTEAGAGKERKGPFIPDLIWGKDSLKACMANAHQILAHHPAWRGVVAYDEFALAVVKRRPPPFAEGAEGEWDSTDDSRTAMWLAHYETDWSFTPSSDTVAEAIEVLGRAHAFHPVRDYLDALEWDRKPRLKSWLSTYLGVEKTPYTQRVAAWWLMGAVMRVLKPGVKFDYCLVLAGSQGKGKSTALSILGGQWFGDTDLDLTHKDSMSALRGKWIYEIAELGALARSEEKKQKSFLSRMVDEYRPVYGRREIKAPRQVVFAGTTNELFEWNKDPTGGRRFWQVECNGEFDLDGLREVRDQLFAEAYEAVKAGARFFPTPDEQREIFDPQQLKVEVQDSLVDAMHDWVYARASDFSLYEVASDCLKLDASKLTRDLQTRMGIALRKLGCGRIEKRNGMTRYWYQPPVKNEASSKSVKPAQHDQETVDVGF